LEIGPGGDVLAGDRDWRTPRPEAGKRNMVLGDVVEQGRDVLKAAVRRHLLSDVRLGVFLSSGLDSTALLGLVREVAGQNVDAFTVSFPEEPGRDEAPIARETAKRLGVGYHECPVDSETAFEWAREGLDRMDQPGLDGLNVYMVSRAVRREGIVVALSGQGGDEVFGGYPSFRDLPRLRHRINRLSLLPAALRTAVVRLATARMNGFVKSKAQELAATRPDTRDLYFGYKRLLASDDLARMGLHPSNLGLTSSFHLPNVCQDEWTIGDDLVASVGRLELAYYLGNTLLRDGDVFGMANSLEIRVPFLDIDVVDWAFRLPGDMILPSNAPSKFLLRKIGSDFYNGAQTRLAKRGFTPPWSTWLLGPLRQLMEEGVCALRESGLIAEEGLNKTREAFFREPDRGTWSRIWTLVVLGHWLRKNGRAPSAA
ncbi:MAG: asparagine synthase, partial [bacterium]|nr:asparagine synthase [bacterium]